SAPTGVEYCLPDFLPECTIAAAYPFFSASLLMSGLSRYLFEVRTASSSGGATFLVLAPPCRRYSRIDRGSQTTILAYVRQLRRRRAADPLSRLLTGRGRPRRQG